MTRRRKSVLGLACLGVTLCGLLAALSGAGSSTMAASPTIDEQAADAGTEVGGETWSYSPAIEYPDAGPPTGGITMDDLSPTAKQEKLKDLAKRDARRKPIDEDPRWSHAKALEQRANVISAEHSSGVELLP